MSEELRKLAVAAIEEAAAYRRGEGSDPDATAKFHAAASPDVVLGLLDRINMLVRMNLDTEEERDEAREAVRRLAGALMTLGAQGSGIPGSTARADCMASMARAALADPVVWRIVESGT